MSRKVLSMEEKSRIFSQLINEPQGRTMIGQTINKSVAPDSNIRMKTWLYAGNSVKTDNPQGRTDLVKCLICNKQTKEEEVIIIEDYKSVGVECLVVWENELKNSTLLKEKLFNYLFPSETTRRASLQKDDDIVRTLQRCKEVERNFYSPILIGQYPIGEVTELARAFQKRKGL
ncbi:MAG: hypothetical protein WC942_10805 [Clostridia bacterium]